MTGYLPNEYSWIYIDKNSFIDNDDDQSDPDSHGLAAILTIRKLLMVINIEDSEFSNSRCKFGSAIFGKHYAPQISIIGSTFNDNAGMQC